MKKWLRKILGIDYIRDLISKNNEDMQQMLTENQKQLEDLKKQVFILSSPNDLPTYVDENLEIIPGFRLGNEQTEMSFNAIDINEFKKDLAQLYIDNESKDLILGTMSNMMGGLANVGLLGVSTRGLFKATANPATLMKLSSGGIGSGVIGEGGKISGHAGFVNPGASIFAPIIIFQIASIVTGQYYMNNIAKQLNTVQEKLNELISLHHIEKQAILIKSSQVIIEYLNKKNFVIEDFVLMKSIISELTNVREEYFLMLDNSTNIIKEDIDYVKLSSMASVREIVKDFEDSCFFFKLKTSLIADELYHLAKVTEFHMNLSYKNPDINRISVISDQLDYFSSFNLENISFYRTYDLYIDLKNKTLGALDYIKDLSWFHEHKVMEIRRSIRRQFCEFDELRDKKINSISSTFQNAIKPFEEDKTIYIDNREGKHELYMEQ